MLHTDAAQQRPGNLPASAPKASPSKPPRAQVRTNPGRPAAQYRKSQLGNTSAADQTAGTMGTSHISVIQDGPAQPPPWNSTPHTSTQTLQQVNAPTILGRAQNEHKAQPARYHSPEAGNEQADSSSLQLGGESTAHATFVQYTLQPKQLSAMAKPGTQHMIMPARDPPLGDGHEQAKHVMGQEQSGLPTKNKQKNPADREIL